jgi:hypothetical protein
MLINKQTYEEYIVCKDTKKQKMCSSNLLLDVPQEILQVYSKFLDLKSNVMFNAACTRSSDNITIKASECNTLYNMFGSISFMIKGLYDIFGTIQGQNKLLANMLRRMIYISVSDIPYPNEVPYVSARTLSEYHKLMLITMETMDISSFDFNNILEDIQFECRGFEILNISEERRKQLNKVTEIIHKLYFSNDFTIYTYTKFGNIYLELQCDKEKVMIDIHERLEDDIFTWSFFADKLKDFVINNPEHDMVKKMKENNIEITNNLVSWNKDNTYAPFVISQLLNELMDCSNIFKGSDDNFVEVWNDTIEVNWLLKDVVSEILSNGMYSHILVNITNSVQNEFHTQDDEQILLL